MPSAGSADYSILISLCIQVSLAITDFQYILVNQRTWFILADPKDPISLSLWVLVWCGPDSKVHGAHLGPAGPRWAPCWLHELCSQGRSLCPVTVVIRITRSCYFSGALFFKWFICRLSLLEWSVVLRYVDIHFLSIILMMAVVALVH